MKINDELLNYLETLTRLSLSPEEREKVTNDLSRILEYMELVKKADINASEAELPHGAETNELRTDEPEPPYDRNLLLKNAAGKDSEFFKAPQIIE